MGGVFNIFLLRQFFLTLPFELDEAAYTYGAAPLAVYWFVVMPLAHLFSAAPFCADFRLGMGISFSSPLLVYLIDSKGLQFGPAEFNSAYSIQWDLLMAASILFFQRFFIQGIVLMGD